MISRTVLRGVVCALVLIGCVPSATAQSSEDFYKGRVVTLVIPVGTGGSFHVYCQTLARHIGKHIPGNPSVVTQNQPGGGGARAARFMQGAAPKDGSVFAMINPGSMADPLFRPDLGFDPRTMRWMGSMSARSYSVAIWHTVPAQTIDDLRTVEVLMGASGRSATTYQIPVFMNATLGTKIKMITGYTGGGDINLALERGEIQGRTNFYSGFASVRPEWLTEKKVRFLVTLGPEEPALPDVPQLRDLLKTDEERQMLSLLELAFNVGQGFYAPPDTSTERVDVLRRAFLATMKDPALITEAKKHDLPLNWLTHDKVEEAIAETYRASPATVKKLADILGKQ